MSDKCIIHVPTNVKSKPTPSFCTLSLCTVIVWSTLQSSEHQNDQTQKQFLPSGNPSHEHLTITVEHTLFIHIYPTHILSLHFNLHIIYLYIQLSICILLFLIYFNKFNLLSFYYLCLLFCHSVALWSFCHKNKFLVCVNIT